MPACGIGGTPGDTAAAEKLHNDRLLATALLDTAGDVAGIRGTAHVTTLPCDTGVGEQVRGSVVIPVFRITDSANAAFDAITASWKANGYQRSDRAAGTDFYAAGTSASRGLPALSIHGTSDGISVQVISECVISQ